MKQFCGALVPIVFGMLLLLPSDAFGQTEADLVKVPLNSYLQAHATGDPGYIRKAFYPDARIINLGNGTMKSLTLEEFAKFFTGNPAQDEAQRNRRIEKIDVSGTAASAKIVLDYPNVTFTDYMNLLKIDGEWKIVNKTFYAERKAKPAQ